MKFFSYLKSIDFLGNSINFTINSNDSFKTIFGGLISFGIYFGYIFLFVTFGTNYFLKKNPSGYSQRKPSLESSKALNLTENPFIMGFQIYDNVGNVIKIDDYFHAIFVYRETNIKDGVFFNNRTTLGGVPCSDIKINENAQLIRQNAR